MEPGEDFADPGVPAPETGPVATQPQTALLPQTVEAGLSKGRRVEGCLGGTQVINLSQKRDFNF